MDRRAFVSMVAARAASPLYQRAAGAQPVTEARNVVLVHGLLADGSCWSEVITRLQPKDIQVTVVQNPLTTLQVGVEATQRALALQQTPTVLVAHSFAGMIVTEAGADPRVSAVGRLVAMKSLLLLIFLMSGCTSLVSSDEAPCCPTPRPGGIMVHLNGAVGTEWSYTRQ